MSSIFEKTYTFDRVVKIVIGSLVALGLFFLIKKLSPVLLPFLLAWLFAYLIYPLVHFYQYKCKLKNRILAIIASLVSIVLIIGLILTIIIPPILSEFVKMSDLISYYINNISSYSLIPKQWEPYLINFFQQLDTKKLSSPETIFATIEKIAPTFWNIVSGAFGFILSLFVIFIIGLYLIFILKDYETISTEWIRLVPAKQRPLISEIASDLETGMNRYFRGQALVAFIVGILFAVGFQIIGLPLAILMGLFIGVLNLVPYLQTVGFIPVVMLALLKSTEPGQHFWWIILSVLIVFVIVQTFQDLVLVPKIMGKVTGMNPAIILLSLSIWGVLLGITGMIIALPITTLIVSYYKRFILGEEANKTNDTTKKRKKKTDDN